MKRAEELDALDAILPFDRRDQLADFLTDDDVATLKHFAKEGMGDNTMRALASDLARRGLDGAFASPALKSALRLSVRAVPRTRRRKSAKAITGDILAKLLATCATDSLRDLRDRAILMVAFASGGRRPSRGATEP